MNLSKTFLTVAMLSSFAFSSELPKNAEKLKVICAEKNGVFSQATNDLLIVYTCRETSSSLLMTVHFPEQTIFLQSGDASEYERILKTWGVKKI